ncbi:MAG TPA: DNA translocase FtsK [Alphaproteobacteria bacterium]|nr:DNA translocase FtsK [Alphaproteobacteria bacterium]HIA22216.1 DNA translocase FtsK [Alphaproteobacteria bacterium]HIB56555.1 DNA translocase FtsK [Alphaproteobacteria bacterium]HIN92856.1 DNA translocase FtsK [Alphaproteobacteria bacterium]
MVSRTHTRRKPTLLPPGTVDYLRRRSLELIGLSLIISAAAILIALASYNPHDPSFNSATSTTASNWLGEPGAYAADLLLSFFGIVSALPALALAGWGWRLIRRHSFDLVWLRLAGTPFLMLIAAATIAAVPLPAVWIQPVTYGGMVGELLLRYQNSACASLALPIWPLTAILGLVTVMAMPLVLGVPKQDGHTVILILWRSIHWTGLKVMRFVNSLVNAVTVRPKSITKGTLARKTRRRSQKRKDRIEPSLRGSQPGHTMMVEPASARTGVREASERQGRLRLDKDITELPPLNLLAGSDQQAIRTAPDDDALAQNARVLEDVLEEFNVRGEIIRVRQGPVVTRYELEPAPGTRSARVIALADDIARSMSAISARVAVVPGQNVIGIELPNAQRETVYLRELIGSADYENTSYQLPLALGKDISGVPIVVDLARMPHLLVAGTTGSGKSVAINSMILSLLYRLRPDSCRLIMIDPKMLELSVYDGIPHLLHPVVTDPKKAVVALKWAVKEMNQRYRLMSNLNVRNVAGYNKRIQDAVRKKERLTRTVQTGFDSETGKPIYEEQPLDMETLPLLIIVVDEMADLMLVAGKDIELAIQSLAQRARAAGIHLIIATQRPSVDVITGTIKANLPTRISFQVTSKIDSRTILGEQGAEQLLSMGDMLYMAGGGQISRVHGPFVSEQEVEKVAVFLRTQGTPNYLDAVTEDEENNTDPDLQGSGDELYDRAIQLVLTERKASTSFVQRHLQIGYNRAARLIDKMEAEGVVGAANHVGKREILVGDANADY